MVSVWQFLVCILIEKCFNQRALLRGAVEENKELDKVWNFYAANILNAVLNQGITSNIEHVSTVVPSRDVLSKQILRITGNPNPYCSAPTVSKRKQNWGDHLHTPTTIVWEHFDRLFLCDGANCKVFFLFIVGIRLLCLWRI